MKKEMQMFKDPNGKFAIGISSDWKYNKDNNDGLHQFEISKECVFQKIGAGFRKNPAL